MYLNDLQRTDFYATIGLDAKQFDKHVIRKTNQSSGTLFPITLDVDNPAFFELLDTCAEANQNLINIDKENSIGFSKTFKKLPSYLNMTLSLLKLYFLPAIETNYIWTEKI
jgi:magnesium-protoporphyrin IX monomethyl ester (oxidative) cyclase